MTRALIALAIIAAAVLVAWLLQRRRPAPPTGGGSYTVPAQIDRDDFDHRDTPWLITVFTSTTCATCASVVAQAHAVGSSEIAVQDVSVQAHPALHERYRIDGVPALLVADRDGVVRASFLGPMTDDDLIAGVTSALQAGAGTAPPAPTETAVDLDGL